MVQLFERNLERRRRLFLEECKETAETVLSERKARALRLSLCLLEDSKPACFRDPWKQHTSVAASGLREAGSVYTCHEGGGGRKRKPERSPKLLNSSREGAAGVELQAGGNQGAGRTSGGQGGNGSHSPGSCPGWQGGCGALRAPPAAFPHPPRKRAEPEPETRRPAEPAPSPQPRLRGGQVLRASVRGRPVGRAGSPHPFPLCGRGSQAAALTWLVRGGRDGHGSGARGGTGSPGKDRLFGAGESGRQAVPSPVSAAAPWTPTRSFSTAAGPPSHYPPPSSAAAAAASTSSSAETPRPLHTLSHHAAGEPLPLTRHFRAQVARSGPSAGGCWGWGEILWGN